MTAKERFDEYIRKQNEANQILYGLIVEAIQEPDTEMVSIKEAAKKLGVTSQTIHVWVLKNRLTQVGRSITVESMKRLAGGKRN